MAFNHLFDGQTAHFDYLLLLTCRRFGPATGHVWCILPAGLRAEVRMIGPNVIGKLMGGVLAVAIGAGVAAAGSDAALALPTTWMLQGATFDDGGTASGEFTIGPYGYLIEPISLTTTAGSLLGGFSYTGTNPSDIVPSTPPAYGVDFFSPSYNLDLHIVFQNPLDSSGVDPIVLASSYECAAY